MDKTVGIFQDWNYPVAMTALASSNYCAHYKDDLNSRENHLP